MDINKILDAGGYVHENPEYNPKTKKGKLQPQYIVNADPNGAINQGSALAGVMSQPGRQGMSLDYLGTPEKYAEYDVTVSPVDASLEKELANEQGALHKFGNAIAQAAISEVALGTVKGVSDLVDVVSSKVFGVTSDDYTNPVSEYLGQLQEDFKNYAPIYSDPDKNIFNGGLADPGWWTSNLPSIMSSLTLMIPSTGITKGLGWLGRSVNTASKGKIGAWGRNAYKAMTGAGKVKTVEEAEKLNKVTKWLNNPNTTAAASRMAETGVNAALMRTMENYQEAHQVYDDMRTKALDMFNGMSNEEYTEFVNRNSGRLGDVDVNDKEAVASKLAKESADRTFIMDYANTIFDVIQLNALRNPIKLLKNMRANATITAADEASRTAIGKAATAATTQAAEKAGIAATAKNFGKGVGKFLKDSAHEIKAEASEGLEEAINYIAQEEGMHYGNVALGEDVDNGFTSRLGSYMRSPELYDAAFWGVLGGVVFQGLGSGLNRISVAAERAYQQKKKKADGTTGEAVNTDSWQELFETSENKRRIADINKRTEDFNTLVQRLDAIEGKDGQPGVDPFNTDENNNPIQLETETEKTIAKERAISEYITGMTFRAMDNGNFDMLKAYLQDANIRQALEEATGNEGDGGAFINSVISRMDHIAESYSNNLIALSNIARNVNIVNKDAEGVIPLEYLQIIARDNTAAQMKLEDLNSRIATYETSAENKKAVFGDKLDKSLNYKDTVQLVVLTQQLAQLRARHAELMKDKTKQGVGRQIELDSIEKNIGIVEGMIRGTEDANGVDALSKLLYSTIQSNLINDKDAYIGNIEALAKGDIASILGEDTAKEFEITDEKLMRVLGADRTSGSYKTLATDIDNVFEGAYGLNKIDKRLGDDYVALAALNLEKAVLSEDIVMNEANLQKKVNELHNDMLDARKQAIDKASGTLRSLAKKYGRTEMQNQLATGNAITWQNEADRKSFDDALEVLNLTSASNQKLYDDIQGMLMMDELIERSQEAANPSGEISATSQNQNAGSQSAGSNNQSGQNQQQGQKQENTLNQSQSGQGQQVQGQQPGTTGGTNGINQQDEDMALANIVDIRNAGDLTKVSDSSLKILKDNADSTLANRTLSAETKLKLQDALNRVNAEIARRKTTNSSTGGQGSNSPSPARDDNGNLVPDAQREAIKTEIGISIRKAIMDAKAAGTNVVEAINKTAQDLNTKYGQDEEFKREINRMVKTWSNIAHKKGLIQDLADVVLLASSVTEQGGKYNFPDEFLEATKTFVNKYLSAANAKEFNGKKVVSFESMLRFANEQMEDPTTAEFIYNSLKAWFQFGPEASKYIVLDNMNSTSILQRAGMTNKELANTRLGGVDVYRVQIDQFLMRNASKAAIDKLQQGDTLNAKVDNGDIILMVGDVEIGRLPQPKINGRGGFEKTNNGWITDVELNNGSVRSNLRGIWEDILLNKSAINDKINNYIYHIIAANKINADTKPIRDAIEKDADLKAYFDGLKQQGIVDKKADNVQLIDGLVNIWNYIDLTSPIPAERQADIQYSLDLWFNKLYDSYTTINNANIIGIDKLIFKVAKISDGDVIQVASNDNEGYDKCTLGNGNDAFANVDTTEVGVIKPGSVGVIQTTANHQVSQPNGSTGSMWAVLPNRGGVPGIVRGHMLKFMDTDKSVNNTPAGRIRQAISNEFERRLKEAVNDESIDGDKFNELMQFIDLVLSDRTSTPLLAPATGGKFKVSKYQDDRGARVVISFRKADGNYTNFTINSEQRMYNTETLGYKPIDEIDTFIKDFKTVVLGGAMFNADFKYLDSDTDVTSPLSGLATRDKNGNFVITIPNGTNIPLVETFPSFKHFLMQGGGARWNTKVENGSNFTPRSTNQLRNQVLNVSIESASSRPVEENVEGQITPDSINNGTAINTLLEQKFGKDSPAVKRLQQAGLIPSEITYTTETLMKGDHPSNIWSSTSKKKIYVNDEFIKTMNENPDMAIRKLIHEQLHLKLHSKGNRRKELLKRIQGIYNDFEKSLGREGVDEHLKEYLFSHINNSQEKLEEFLVESLTNRELASYLNTVDATAADTKTKKSIFDKILELLADIFDWKVTEGSLYEKELKVLQGYAAEEIQEGEQPSETESVTEVEETPAEETSEDDEFDEDDYDGMAASVNEVSNAPISKEMQTIKEQAIANGTFMKAPNGKDTNLTERQWLQVRTKNFINWFGDWMHFDKANPYSSKIFVTNVAPDYDSADAEGPGAMFAIFEGDKYIGSIAINANYKGKNSFKTWGEKGTNYVSMSSVGDAVEIEEEFRGKGYGKAAYFEFAKQMANMGYVLRSAPTKSRTEASTRVWKSLERDGYAKKVEDRYEFINSSLNNASKVVDENGEPKVVYHGSKTNITIFDSSKSDTRNELSKIIKPTNFFSDDKTVADAFAKTEKQSVANAIAASFNEVAEAQVEDENEVWNHVANSVNKSVDWVKNFWLNELSLEERMDASDGIMYDTNVENQKYQVFLNLKNPIIIDAKGERADKVLEENKEVINNSDEVIILNIDETVGKQETATDYLVRKSNNVKSATGNNGEFSTEKNDIYASSVQESTAPSVNQFVETLPLEERVEFNRLLLDGTISMKCS